MLGLVKRIFGGSNQGVRERERMQGGRSWGQRPLPPVLVYQHAPKCGGRSFIKACQGWFTVVADQPPPYPDAEQVAEFARTRLDVDAMEAGTLVHGHLIRKGIRPLERYPEGFRSGRCGLITVVRSPLEQAISAYFHRRRKGRPWEGSLEEWLERRANNLCQFLGVTLNRNGSLPDERFDFIGVTERMQDSLDVMAALAGKQRVVVDHINKSPRDEYALSDSFIRAFQERNAMDYALLREAGVRLDATKRKFNL